MLYRFFIAQLSSSQQVQYITSFIMLCNVQYQYQRKECCTSYSYLNVASSHTFLSLFAAHSILTLAAFSKSIASIAILLSSVVLMVSTMYLGLRSFWEMQWVFTIYTRNENYNTENVSFRLSWCNIHIVIIYLFQ